MPRSHHYASHYWCFPRLQRSISGHNRPTPGAVTGSQQSRWYADSHGFRRREAVIVVTIAVITGEPRYRAVTCLRCRSGFPQSRSVSTPILSEAAFDAEYRQHDAQNYHHVHIRYVRHHVIAESRARYGYTFPSSSALCVRHFPLFHRHSSRRSD